MKSRSIEKMAATSHTEAFTEAEVQRRLEELFEGGHQHCDAGIPDIVSMKYGYVIEIKNVRNWREGFGQISSYADFFPQLTPVLYLFGQKAEMASAPWRIIQNTCRGGSIQLMRDDEDYAKIRAERDRERGMTCHEFVEETAYDCEAEGDRQVDSDRTMHHSMKKHQEIIKRQIARLIQSFDCFTPEQTGIRTTLMEFSHELRSIKDRFDMLTSDLNDAGRLAADCIDSEIIFDATGTVSLVSYKDIVKRWHVNHGNASLISEVRRRMWDILDRRGVRMEKRKAGGATIVGIRLKNDPRKIEEAKRTKSSS